LVATGTPNLSYQWYKNGASIGSATSSSYTTPVTVPLDNGTSFYCQVTNAVGIVSSSTATLTVDFAPAITTQPSNQTVAVGQTATFSLVATGNPAPAYQWYKNGASIGSATASSYTTPVTTLLDSGTSFYCQVSNSVGSLSSSTATLTVSAGSAPTITTQPSNQTVTAGQTATFSLVATGVPAPSYQWYKNGASIGSATSSSYTTPVTTSLDNGTSFYCQVSNVAGSVSSSTATLTVDFTPAITTQPSNQTVTAGQTATFSLVATGNPAPSYQWYKNGASIGSATSSSYTTPVTVPLDDGTKFYCQVTNSVGTLSSSTATLTVDFAPAITTQPSNQTVNPGQTATFSLVATGNPAPAYQWYKNGASIGSATASSYTTPATTLLDNGTSFYCEVGNSVGSLSSSTATLTVSAGSAPAITTQPLPQNGLSGQTVAFSVMASGSGLSYQWMRNGATISGATSNNYTSPTLTWDDSGAGFSCMVSNSHGSVTSASAILTIVGAWGIVSPGQDFNLVFRYFSGSKTAWFNLSIPAGTLAKLTTLTLLSPNSIDFSSQPGISMRSTGAAFTATTNPDLEPSSGRSVTFTVDHISGLTMSASDKLTLAYLDTTRNYWIEMPTQTNSDGTLTISSSHLSTFALMDLSPSDNLDSARVFPNPFRPSQGHTQITFANLPAGCRVRIYTVAGEKVTEFNADNTGIAVWDGNNSSGNHAASEVYFALLEGNGLKKTLKVAIQR